MGHTVNAGQDDHYRPIDVEFHRELYAEKAMPHLRLETATPTETDKAIISLEQENRELKDQIERLESVMEKMYQKVFRDEFEQEEETLKKEHPEHFDKIEKMYAQKRKEEDYSAKHPEERRKLEEQAEKEYEEFKESLEETETEFERVMRIIDEQIIRLDERKKTLRELQDSDFRDLIKKTKK